MSYEFKTTFWMDFTIADKFGIEAVKDTFKRAFSEWKTDYITVIGKLDTGCVIKNISSTGCATDYITVIGKLDTGCVIKNISSTDYRIDYGTVIGKLDA